MKRLIHSFAAIMLAAVTLGLTACHDDIDPNHRRSPIEDNDYEPSTLAELCPSNVILDPSAGKTTIKLGVDNLEHDVFQIFFEPTAGATEFYTLYSDTVYIKKTDDLKFNGTSRNLELVNKDAPEGLYVMCVYRENNEDDWYPITISVRSSEMLVDGDLNGEDEYENKMRKRAAEYMCYPISMGDSTAHVKEEYGWIDEKSIMKYPEVLKVRKDGSKEEVESTGSTNQKSSDFFKKNVGIGGFGEFFGAIFSLNAEKKHSEKKDNESEREYYSMRTYIKAVTATFQTKKLRKYKSAVIDNTLNSTLNDPTSTDYQDYNDTPEGMCEMIEDFGLFLSPTALFGATCSYTYSRTSNISSTSVSDDAKVSLSIRKPADGATSLVQAIVMASKYFSNVDQAKSDFHASVETGEDHSKYEKVTHAESRFFSNGGNSLDNPDAKNWKATENPDNWNLLSFQTTINPEKVNPICLLDFIVDNKSKRYKALHDVLYDEDGNLLSKDSYYYKYLDEKWHRKMRNAVVADVYAEWMRPADIKAKIMTGNDGVLRLYQPFIFNNRYPISERERYPVAINNGITPNIITRGSAGGKALVLYYAMDDHRYTSGLLDIVVAEKNGLAGNIAKEKGYHLRGQSWHEGGGDVAKTKDKGTILDAAVFVRYAPKGFATPITAVGLVSATQFLTGGIHFSKDMIGRTFASTSGTELMTTTEGDTKKIWEHYWDPVTAPIYFSWIPSENHPKGHPVINVCTKNAPIDRIPEYTIGYWLTDDGFSSPFDLNWRGNWKKFDYSFHVYGTGFSDGVAAQTPSDKLTPSNWIQDIRPPLFVTVRGNYGGDGDGQGQGDDDNNCFGIVYSTQPLEGDYVSPPRSFLHYN